MSLPRELQYLHRSPRRHAEDGYGRHVAATIELSPDGTPFTVVRDNGGHEGRHHRPHPDRFPEDCFYWSDPAEAWMRAHTDRADELIHQPDGEAACTGGAYTTPS